MLYFYNVIKHYYIFLPTFIIYSILITMLSKNDFIENNLIPNNDNCKDISTKLKEFLQQNIPEALNGNGEPDLTKIKNLLGLNSLSGYELKFPGKGIANALYSATIYKELQNENPTNDIAENFIIEGDNLML